MKDDKQKWTSRLNNPNSLLEQDTGYVDAYVDDARVVDISQISTEKIRDRAVTSIKLAETLALGTVTVDVLTGGTITGEPIFYGKRDLIRYSIMCGDF